MSIEVLKTREIQEIQAAFIMARQFPRDQSAAVNRIMESCKRIAMAEQGLWSFPRGGQTISGPSIRLAEMLCQNWGNIRAGRREIERRPASSLIETFCIDLETNFAMPMQFEVPHEIKANGQLKRLTDPRDIYEHVANQAARRLRACILAVIPSDVVESAKAQCQETIRAASKERGRIDQMLMAFAKLGIDRGAIERRLGHDLDQITADEMVDLTGIYVSLRDKVGKRSDYFDYRDDSEESEADALSAKLMSIT